MLRERCRTSTSPARTASARRGTRRPRSGTRSPTASSRDVYYPTIDTTNVETLQYVVTDGKTFTDLQTRDTTYTAAALDATGMTCRVVSTAKSGRYRIVTDYLTDPARDSVVMRTTLLPAKPKDRLDVYVRFDATVNGNGGGGAATTAAPTPRSSTPRPSTRCRSRSTP